MVRIKLPRHAWFLCPQCGQQQLKVRATGKGKPCSITPYCKGKLIETGPAEVSHE